MKIQNVSSIIRKVNVNCVSLNMKYLKVFVLNKIKIVRNIVKKEDVINVKMVTIYLLIQYAFLKNQDVFIKKENVQFVNIHLYSMNLLKNVE